MAQLTLGAGDEALTQHKEMPLKQNISASFVTWNEPFQIYSNNQEFSANSKYSGFEFSYSRFTKFNSFSINKKIFVSFGYSDGYFSNSQISYFQKNQAWNSIGIGLGLIYNLSQFVSAGISFSPVFRKISWPLPDSSYSVTTKPSLQTQMGLDFSWKVSARIEVQQSFAYSSSIESSRWNLGLGYNL